MGLGSGDGVVPGAEGTGCSGTLLGIASGGGVEIVSMGPALGDGTGAGEGEAVVVVLAVTLAVALSSPVTVTWVLMITEGGGG